MVSVFFRTRRVLSTGKKVAASGGKLVAGGHIEQDNKRGVHPDTKAWYEAQRLFQTFSA